MGFPSLALIGRETERTIERFPLSIAAATAGAVAIIGEVENVRFLMIVVLGISWFLAVDLLIEGIDWKGWKKSGMRLFAASLLVLYAFTLPPEKISEMEWIRYALFISGTHFLVAFALFVRRGPINAFWAFNKTLFIRFLTSSLYSLVFYAGLGLAILAIDKLFNVDVDTRVYYDLFALLAGPFATIFFLAGVPVKGEIPGEIPEEVTAYPRGLKIFTQYVLLPIIAVYFVILYAYMGRIIVNWAWPIGWVSLPVLGFSIVGVLSFLLLYPIRDDEDNRWVRSFARWLYVGILPLAALLLLAIGRRVLEYGFTEPRYIVVLLGIWLVGISLYFLLSRRDNIKVIPVSLGVAAFLISFGPWGVFAVSTRSQLTRLETILTDHSMLVDGKFRANDTVDLSAAREIVSIVRTLEHRNALDDAWEWFPPGTRLWNPTMRFNTDAADLLTAMEIRPYDGVTTPHGEIAQREFTPERFLNLMEQSRVIPVRGFDYSTSIVQISEPTRVVTLEGIIQFGLDSSKRNVRVSLGDTLVAIISLEPTVRRLYDSVVKVDQNDRDYYNYSLQYGSDPTRSPMTIDASNGTLRCRLILHNIRFHIDSLNFEMVEAVGELLVATGSISSPPVPQRPSGGVSPP